MMHTVLLLFPFIICAVNAWLVGSSRRRAQKAIKQTSDDNDKSLLSAALLQAQERDFDKFQQEQAPEWLKSVKGLPFDCTECGKCCQTVGRVSMSPTEVRAAAALLNMSQSDFVQQFASHTVEDSWIYLKEKRVENHTGCIFLDVDTNQCRIYEARPVQCRTYPFWPSVLASPQAWNDECRRPVHDNNSSLPMWTASRGGCEGMQPLNSTSNSSTVSVSQVYRQLYEHEKAQRRFPGRQ